MGLGPPVRGLAVTYVVGRRFLGVLGDELLAVEFGDRSAAIQLLVVLEFVLWSLLVMAIRLGWAWFVRRVGRQAHSGIRVSPCYRPI